MKGMADFAQLWQLGQQMQGRLHDIQAELANRVLEGSAGGGMVRVMIDGRGAIRDVQIDPAAFAGRDAELLGDLVLSAIADAQRRAGDLIQAEMRKLPASPFSPGL
jgi:DNA-binding YbaB/EbfC family protein